MVKHNSGGIGLDLLLLEIGCWTFGIEVDRAVDLLGDAPCTRVPGAHPSLAGLINLRGEVIPVVDLRSILGIEVSDRQRECLLILRGASGLFGLAAGRPQRILSVQQPKYHNAPETFNPTIASRAKALLTLADRLLILLDVDLLSPERL